MYTGETTTEATRKLRTPTVIPACHPTSMVTTTVPTSRYTGNLSAFATVLRVMFRARPTGMTADVKYSERVGSVSTVTGGESGRTILPRACSHILRVQQYARSRPQDVR